MGIGGGGNAEYPSMWDTEQGMETGAILHKLEQVVSRCWSPFQKMVAIILPFLLHGAVV